MAHYALLNNNNEVMFVIKGRDENEIVEGISDWEKYYGDFYNMKCKRTSYNSLSGKRINPETNEIVNEKGFRGNFASVNYYYDEKLDAFIPTKPFESWILNENLYGWEPPKPIPNDGKSYIWNEEIVDWQEVII